MFHLCFQPHILAAPNSKSNLLPFICVPLPHPFTEVLISQITNRMHGGLDCSVWLQEIQPPTKPSVFVMKNGTNVACLVKDFYPKDISINLKSSKKITEFDPAIVVSPSGKYNAVKLGQYEDSNSVTCSVQHSNTIVYSTDFELEKNSSDNLTPMETENTKQSSKSCHEPKVHAEKVNMMSLTVLELRMLLAKSVAINFLLTAKLFFF
uniref:T cell receptor delta constant n=2 Tax=Callithrix jacchus TaxID=9483 RepID=A0A8I3W8S4_CALJA